MRIVPLLALPVLLAGCRALEPTFAEPATIIIPGDTAKIIAPDSVPRGVRFQVSVETFGGGCTRNPAYIGSKVFGTVAELRPFNETTKAGVRGGACTFDLLILTHTATVQMKEAGPATIEVIGVQRDLAGRETPVQIRRVVTVQ